MKKMILIVIAVVLFVSFLVQTNVFAQARENLSKSLYNIASNVDDFSSNRRLNQVVVKILDALKNITFMDPDEATDALNKYLEGLETPGSEENFQFMVLLHIRSILLMGDIEAFNALVNSKRTNTAFMSFDGWDDLDPVENGRNTQLAYEALKLQQYFTTGFFRKFDGDPEAHIKDQADALPKLAINFVQTGKDFNAFQTLIISVVTTQNLGIGSDDGSWIESWEFGNLNNPIDTRISASNTAYTAKQLLQIYYAFGGVDVNALWFQSKISLDYLNRLQNRIPSDLDNFGKLAEPDTSFKDHVISTANYVSFLEGLLTIDQEFRDGTFTPPNTTVLLTNDERRDLEGYLSIAMDWLVSQFNGSYFVTDPQTLHEAQLVALLVIKGTENLKELDTGDPVHPYQAVNFIAALHFVVTNGGSELSKEFFPSSGEAVNGIGAAPTNGGTRNLSHNAQLGFMVSLVTRIFGEDVGHEFHLQMLALQVEGGGIWMSTGDVSTFNGVLPEEILNKQSPSAIATWIIFSLTKFNPYSISQLEGVPSIDEQTEIPVFPEVDVELILNNETATIRVTSPNGLSTAVLKWGAKDSTEREEIRSDSLFATQHDFNLTGLIPGVIYVYDVKVTNEAGNMTPVTGEFVTADTVPPEVALSVESAAEKSIRIKMTTTEPATSQILFTPDSTFRTMVDTLTNLNQLTERFFVMGSQNPLIGGTVYFVRASAFDGSGNQGIGVLRAETSPDTTAGMIITFKDSSVYETGFTAVFKIDDPDAFGTLEISPDINLPNDSTTTVIPYTSNATGRWGIDVNGLEPGSVVYMRLTVNDLVGNTRVSEVMEVRVSAYPVLEVLPFEITDDTITVAFVSDSSATVRGFFERLGGENIAFFDSVANREFRFKFPIEIEKVYRLRAFPTNPTSGTMNPSDSLDAHPSEFQLAPYIISYCSSNGNQSRCSRVSTVPCLPLVDVSLPYTPGGRTDPLPTISLLMLPSPKKWRVGTSVISALSGVYACVAFYEATISIH